MQTELTAFLDDLADAASAAILPHFRSFFQVENKLQSGFDPVTIADRAGEEVMRSLINTHYKEHGILGEEFGAENVDADRVWILDPIDGTRAFITGLPTWGVLIGHKHLGKADIGMMCQPFTGERFAGDGKRAWYKGPDGNRELKTRSCEDIAAATMLTTDPDIIAPDCKAAYLRVEQKAQLKRYGTDCYAYSMVAAGYADCVLETDLNSYDIAALIPIVEGAGGIVTTWDGGNPVDGGNIVACGDKQLHAQILELLNT